jgi:hypothetical protein
MKNYQKIMDTVGQISVSYFTSLPENAKDVSANSLQ